jgi:osmotically-inducible protein OsmY
MNRQMRLEQNDSTKRHTSWVKCANIDLSTDAALATAAVDAIECLTTVPLETINVTARHGWLHLDGTVTGVHQRTTVEDVTRHLPGVRGVIDSMVIEAR